MSADRFLTVGLTGAFGLLGTHTRALFHTDRRFQLALADRATFQSDQRLDDFVAKADVIIHYAGMNRGSDEEILSTNTGLTRQLIAALERKERRPRVIFASSTHIDRPTFYGDSKRQCTALLTSWAERWGTRFTSVVLPNVFGEGGRPFYNSAVSTFCHQLAIGDTPAIHSDSVIELMHAHSVAVLMRDLILTDAAVEVRPKGHEISVSKLLATLRRLCESYRAGIIPALTSELDMPLFNTLRTELHKRQPFSKLELRTDPRGALFESVKSLQGGQSFVSTTKPGITRGNHFHFRKFERFVVLEGEAMIRLRRLFHSDIQEISVSGREPKAVDMPTLYTHSITNIGTGPLTTQFWTNEIFDRDNTDTYPEMVMQ